MSTIEENLAGWTAYEWSQQGEEWSQAWGDTEHLWWGTLYPRIMGFLPAGTALEIAPGFGRITRFLKDECRRLIGVDLTPRCIEACRQRFGGDPHVEFHVNDGLTLGMVDDDSIDFAFSFDSLVHAEADVLHSYVRELGRTLAPTGVGFIHHSNLGAFVDPATGELPFPALHHRATSTSAQLFRQSCEELGVRCLRQEIINWGGDVLHDCFSVIAKAGSPQTGPCTIWENPGFMTQAYALGATARHYRCVSEHIEPPRAE